MSDFDKIIRQELIRAWATPILTLEFSQLDSLNERLANLILEKEKELSVKENLKEFPQVWNKFSQLHIKQQLFLWDDPDIQCLKSLILQSCQQFINNVTKENIKITKLEGWANIHRKADWHGLHSHYAGGGETISGVYWVQTPMIRDDNELNGHTIYFDPRGFFFPGKQKKIITPKAGTMVLHPSWLPHSVAPVKDDCERISIAFDAHANYIIS
jgi:hypothetical protein